MPNYTFQALDREGHDVNGQVDAEGPDAAFLQLRRRGLAPVKLEETKPPRRFRLNKELTLKELAVFPRQLALMVSAGVPLMDAVDSFTHSVSNPLLAEKARDVRATLRAGDKLSTALEKHLPALPEYVPRLAELGETTGDMGSALTEAADQLEYEQRIAAEIRSALTYPTFLAIMGTLIVAVMFIFVVPRFADLLEGSGADVPLISSIIINFSVWFKSRWWLFFGGLLVIFVLISMLSKRNANTVPAMIERLPVLSRFQATAELARWSRTLGGAVSRGSDLLPALDLAQRLVKAPRLQRQLSKVRQAVRSGETIDRALSEHVRYLDPLVVDLIRTGRSSGKLGEMLLFAADIYKREMQERTKRLTALAEPLAVVLISLIVGTIVISIVLAMTSVYEIGL